MALSRRPRPFRRTRGSPASDPRDVALRLLAGRELSAQQVRDRLQQRGFEPHSAEAAVVTLQRKGLLDDRRTALAVARRAVAQRYQGRVRILQELEAIGISRDVARSAVAEVMSELDEQALIERAIRKRFPGRVNDPATFRRLYAYLLRRGFSPTAVVAALKARGGAPGDLETVE